MHNKQDYQAHLGSTFAIPLEAGNLELELIEVSSINADTTARGQTEPFVVLFRAAVSDDLQQGTYTIKHKEMGEFALFIVPIGPDDTGMRYEAVFT